MPPVEERPGPLAGRGTRSSARVLGWTTAAALAALLVWTYRVSPQRKFLDSKFVLLSSHALLERGSFDLSPYLAFDGESADEAGARRRLPYQLRRSRGRLLYLYTPGTAILSAPFVAVLRHAGHGVIGPAGSYDSVRERRLQGVIAAWITAGTVVLVFWAARRELSALPAATVALAAGLGTGLWSVASRVLWTHTWSTFLIAAAWLELLRWEDGERRRGALLGALLAALFWVRPTGALVAASVAIYVLWRHRRAVAGLLTSGALGLAGFLALAYELWGAPFPTYFSLGKALVREPPRFPPVVFLEMLASPGRGLLAFSPILLLVIWWLVRHRVAPSRRPLAVLAAGITLAYLVLYSRWGWGGTVGPRFLCDPTPLFAWIGAHAWRRARESAGGRRRPARRLATAAVGGLLLAASATAHGAIAWDVRGFARKPAARKEEAPRPPRLPRRLFPSAIWQWRALPQLELPQVLGALERRRERLEREAAAAAARRSRAGTAPSSP